MDDIPSAPCLILETPTVDFGATPQGGNALSSIAIRNRCDATHHIRGLRISTVDGFCVVHPDAQCPATGAAPGAPPLDVTFATPEPVAAGETWTLPVTARPQAPRPATAYLIIRSDDVHQDSAMAAELKVNHDAPCYILFEQGDDFVGKADAVFFGGQVVGTVLVRSLTLAPCPGSEVTVFTVERSGDVQFSALPARPLPTLVTEEAPLTIQVSYAPTAVSPADSAGHPIPDTAALKVRTNSYIAERSVPLRGIGVLKPCPQARMVARIDGAPLIADTVAPGTQITLSGASSEPAYGVIERWDWTIEGPPQSTTALPPGPGPPVVNPQFQAAGTYTVTLDVTDSAGLQACAPDARVFEVVPETPLHIELLWATPGDPDPTDTGLDAGSDLDLHLLHPFGTGADIDGDGVKDGWFDIPFDVFWNNIAPSWPDGARGTALERDDRDGSGPERIIGTDLPPVGAYRIGVHAFADHGYGSSTATIRVYIDGLLAHTLGPAAMSQGEFWDAGTLDWTNATVAPRVAADGGFVLMDAATGLGKTE